MAEGRPAHGAYVVFLFMRQHLCDVEGVLSGGSKMASVVTEAHVKKAVKELLKAFGAYQHWPVQTGFGSPTLDCIGCYKGAYFAVETKRPGKHMTPRQRLTATSIREAGGAVFTVGEVDFPAKRLLSLDGTPVKVAYSGMEDVIDWMKIIASTNTSH